MQSKGAIRIFAILLTLVCLYQISFTFVARNVENRAKELSGGDSKKEQSYLDSISTQPVYNLLVKNFTYGECRDNQINLGLDLKGGMNVTLEVSLSDLLKSLSNYSTDTVFTATLADAVEMEKNSQDDFVTLFGKCFEKRSPNGKLAAIFATKEMSDRIPMTASNEEVLKVIRAEADDAINRSFNILRTRIDKFGVTQPNIQKLANGRILIELPGVKEPERVRKLLQGTAKLEFWETFESKDVLEYLAQVDTYLKAKISGQAALNTDTAVVATDSLTSKADTLAAKADTSNSLMSQLSSKDSAGADTSKAKKDFRKENPLFSIFRPAVDQDGKGGSFTRKGPVVGYAEMKDVEQINEYLAMPGVKAIFPKELKLLWGAKAIDKEGKIVELLAVKMTSRDGRAPLEGDVVTDARQDFGQFGNEPEITMGMNADGARIWKRMTGENIGRCVAIVLDDYVYSYPVVQGEIPSGRTSITGKFTINEAKDLANILKAGKMPAPARIVEEAVVGPSLGKEAISSSFISFLIALALVLVFMVAYYNNAGLIANIALFANLFFIFGILASFSAVLTLPGVAGLVLIVAMSVDANILIFERIREEMALGKGMKLAISDGFKHAFSSIIDSNVTTLLLGIILYVFGSGPVQGFATTLIIGILTSLFSAIFITRLIFEMRLDKGKTIKFGNSMTMNAFKNINVNFVKSRKLYYMFSGAIITLGVVFYFIHGFNFGVDFKGGRTYTVRFEKEISSTQVREVLTAKFGGVAPEVKTFGADNQLKVMTTYLISDTRSNADSIVEATLNEGLSTITDNKGEIKGSQKVGPVIADDLRYSAVGAILFSCLVMFLFILLRFKKWQYGLGAVVALFHDVFMVLSFYTIFNGILPFSLEIDQAFIAAILTVMGYSMTDTVVVFDRIREYLSKNTAQSTLQTTINTALNATLSRTINTSLTIFFVLLAIFIFGGEVIRGFSFALLIGIVVGTYSSICIATPIVIDFQKKDETKN